jgi:Holliday junction resolvase-like predicted endonuclease
MVDQRRGVEYNKTRKSGGRRGIHESYREDTIRHGGNVDKGKWGEELAASYLRHKGYQIVFHNFHSKYGELDIVAKKNNLLVFVEVKTRNTGLFWNARRSSGCKEAKAHDLRRQFFCTPIWISKCRHAF